MKRMTRLGILLLFGAATSTAPYAATLYKSIGPDGKVVYSDRPPADGRIDKTMQFENLPSSTLPVGTSTYVEQLRKANSLPSTNATNRGVVLYAAVWCGYCKQAKSYLARNGIKYQEFDVDTQKGMAAFAQTGSGKGIPLLIVDDQRVQGFSLAAYDVLFRNRK